jgi:hypothetical protein
MMKELPIIHEEKNRLDGLFHLFWYRNDTNNFI